MSNVVRKIVKCAAAGRPLGAYSQAVIVDKTMYISGQIGLDPDKGELVSDNVEAQAEQTLKNMKAILQSAGVDMGNVVKTTILLADINDWPKVNSIYEKYFTSHFPARAAFAVSALPKGARVEIEATAVLGTIQDAD